MDIARIKQIAIPAGTLILGAGSGYIFAKRKFTKQAEVEIQSVKDAYSRAEKPASPAEMVDYIKEDIESTAEALRVKVSDLGYVGAAAAEAQSLEERIEVQGSQANFNIFDEDDEVEVNEGFVSQPIEGEPYIITTEQYMNENVEWVKADLTYFEGDNVLIDSREEQWPDHAATVGIAALSSFGVGANDNDVVHVRNQSMNMDFEITRDRRTYVEVILGVPTEEDERPRILKMRNSD